MCELGLNTKNDRFEKVSYSRHGWIANIDYLGQPPSNLAYFRPLYLPAAQYETAQVLFSIICENGILSHDSLMLCSTVCHPWYEAVKSGVKLVKHLYFNPCTDVTHDKVISLSSLNHKQLKTAPLATPSSMWLRFCNLFL